MLDFINSLDLAVLQWLRIGPEPSLSHIVVQKLSNSTLLKGAFVAVLFWMLWFRVDSERKTRTALIALVGVAMIAVVVGRVAQVSLPFRERPMANDDIPGNPFLHLEHYLDIWSSLPSDHAVFYFAFAFGLLLIELPFGLVAMAHAALVVCLPRIALWLHAPSDIVAGALLGILLTALLFRPFTRLVNRLGLVDHFDRSPSLAYAFMFLVSYEIATTFSAIRGLLSFTEELVTAAAM